MSHDKTKRCTDFQQLFNDNLDTYLPGAYYLCPNLLSLGKLRPGKKIQKKRAIAYLLRIPYFLT